MYELVINAVHTYHAGFVKLFLFKSIKLSVLSVALIYLRPHCRTQRILKLGTVALQNSLNQLDPFS